jgi:hypothetical protein
MTGFRPDRVRCGGVIGMTNPTQRRAVTIALRHADAFITRHHRHHPAPIGAQFAVGIASGHRLIGVAIIGRPVPPAPDDGLSAEITRTGTDGTPHVEVALYRAAWSLIRARGYRRLITHTQAGEITLGLREVGLRPVATLPPRAGSHTPKRPRADRGVDGVCRTRWEIAGVRALTRDHSAVPSVARRPRMITQDGQNHPRSDRRQHPAQRATKGSHGERWAA